MNFFFLCLATRSKHDTPPHSSEQLVLSCVNTKAAVETEIEHGGNQFLTPTRTNAQKKILITTVRAKKANSELDAQLTCSKIEMGFLPQIVF